MYRAFYNIIRLGEPVEADNAVTVSAGQILGTYFPLMKEDREYFGLIDRDDTTLQMLYDGGADEFWVEVPRPDIGGAYGAKLSYESARELLQNLPETFPLEGFDGFSFERWSG